MSRVEMKLCSYCAKREGVKRVSVGRCDLCGRAIDKVEEIGRDILSKLKDYEFRTFLIGATVPSSLIDREDEFRAANKVKGRESVKSQITRVLTRQVAKATGKQPDYSKPDLTVLVSFSDSSVSIYPKSVWLSGRYLKLKRGIPQRSSECEVCHGLGCAECNYKGDSESVQSAAALHFRDKFDAQSCNFIWLGSEDKNSLVKGSGRPFFVEVCGPKKRFDNKSKRSLDALLSFNSKRLQIRDVERLSSRVAEIPKFDIKCRVYLRKLGSEDLTATKVSEVEKNFSNSIVSVMLSRKYRTVRRFVKSVKMKIVPDKTRAEITIECEGGIPIKKLVSGRDGSVEPNFSDLIVPYQIDEERPFDILDVKVRPKASSGEKERKVAGTAGNSAPQSGRYRDSRLIFDPSASLAVSHQQMTVL
jgi:tRNA pseudouridine synthase 10